MIVVSDSGPLISLMKGGQLSILHSLYGEVLIPEAVFSELTTNPRYEEEATIIKTCAFIRVVAVEDRRAVSILQRATGLDLGESEAIVFADDHDADVLLMEEDAGRQVARKMHMHVRGSIGVLLYGFDKKVLTADDVNAALEGMKKAERRISKDLYQYAYEYIRR